MPEVTRRDVLRLSAVVAGAAALSACTGGGGEPAPTDPGGPEDPDRSLRAEIGRSEAALIAVYAAAAQRLEGALAAEVSTLGERHPAYRQAIDPDRLGDLAPSPSDGGSASPLPSPSAPTLPASPAAVVKVLLEAESAAAAERARQAVAAADGELARVIVLAGAGSAAAAQVLRRAGS